MRKIIVYCHGFDSSPSSGKVQRLADAFYDDHVYAFPIKLDPKVAEQELRDCVDAALQRHSNEETKLIFVGTSLGGWWASRLSKIYGCTAIVINPSHDPSQSLLKYGVKEDYEPIEYDFEKNQYFIALHDEVIPHGRFMSLERARVYDSPDVTHRFNGAEFEDVIELLEAL